MVSALTWLRTYTAPWLVSAVFLWTAAAPAQEIGTTAEVEGTVELGRAGTRIPLTIGTAIHTGDEVRTGQPGRAVFVFDDDSVLVIGDNSRIRIAEHEFQRGGAAIRSIIELVQGRIRALVSGLYGGTDATYEIRTPNALAGVRGTEFVTAYDPVAEVTDVVGVSGTVRVASPIAPAGRGAAAARGVAMVGPHELTTVAQAEPPTPPRYIPDTKFRAYLDGLEFIGQGGPESLAAASLLAGRSVPPSEQAEAFPGPFARRGEPGDLPVRPRTPADVMGEPLPPGYYGPTSLGNVGIDF